LSTGQIQGLNGVSKISSFVGFVVYGSTLILNVFLEATSFKILEHQLRQHNTTRWDLHCFRITLQTKTGCSHSLLGQQVQNRKLMI